MSDIESAAEHIYAAMVWAKNTGGIANPWVPGGNSDAQMQARRTAERIMEAHMNPKTTEPPSYKGVTWRDGAWWTSDVNYYINAHSLITHNTKSLGLTDDDHKHLLALRDVGTVEADLQASEECYHEICMSMLREVLRGSAPERSMLTDADFSTLNAVRAFVAAENERCAPTTGTLHITYEQLMADLESGKASYAMPTPPSAERVEPHQKTPRQLIRSALLDAVVASDVHGSVVGYNNALERIGDALLAALAPTPDQAIAALVAAGAKRVTGSDGLSEGFNAMCNGSAIIILPTTERA